MKIIFNNENKYSYMKPRQKTILAWLLYVLTGAAAILTRELAAACRSLAAQSYSGGGSLRYIVPVGYGAAVLIAALRSRLCAGVHSRGMRVSLAVMLLISAAAAVWLCLSGARTGYEPALVAFLLLAEDALSLFLPNAGGTQGERGAGSGGERK